MIDTQTKLCCVIGHPIAQSISPLVHNTAYKLLGLNYALIAFDITDVKGAITGMRALGIKGISVTIPHKREVMRYVDEIDEIGHKIGAVNTIVNNNCKLFATNTDLYGAITALERRVNLRGKKISLIGAGGAARALVYGLKQKGSLIHIFNRSKDDAESLAKEFQLEGSFHLSDVNKIEEADIIINATPVGMIPHIADSPIPPEIISKKHIVFDIINKPYMTKLLKEAQGKGATIIHGSEMLIYGASKQFKLFTGYDLPIDKIEKTLRKYLY